MLVCNLPKYASSLVDCNLKTGYYLPDKRRVEWKLDQASPPRNWCSCRDHAPPWGRALMPLEATLRRTMRCPFSPHSTVLTSLLYLKENSNWNFTYLNNNSAHRVFSNQQKLIVLYLALHVSKKLLNMDIINANNIRMHGGDKKMGMW